MTTITGYYYPWDIIGSEFDASAHIESRIDRIALAASYHSVRAATPTHPTRRVVDAYDAALYVPVESEVWPDRGLVPRDATEWTGTDNSFGVAAAVIREAGIPVDAWVVLNHTSFLGRKNPDLCVTNAFGEKYSYALCPSNADVQEYAFRVVEQVIEKGSPDGLILEAIGPLGFGHQNQHEKTDGADYNQTVQDLLSLCFCKGCCALYEISSVDVARVQEALREEILIAQSDPRRAIAATEGIFAPLLSIRWLVAAQLIDRITSLARRSGVDRVVLNVSAGPWVTGAFLSAEALESMRLPHNLFLLPAWGEVDKTLENLRSVKSMVDGQSTFAAYVLSLPPKLNQAEMFARDWQKILSAGFDELHIYHLGLASKSRKRTIFDVTSSLE